MDSLILNETTRKKAANDLFNYLTAEGKIEIVCDYPEVFSLITELANKNNLKGTEKTAEKLRSTINQILSNNQTNTNNANGLYYLLLFLAKYWPRNLVTDAGEVVCPFAIEAITDKRRVIISDGYQFDNDELVKSYQMAAKGHKNLGSINPATRQSFPFRDVANLNAHPQFSPSNKEKVYLELRKAIIEHAESFTRASFTLSAFLLVSLWPILPSITVALTTAFLFSMASTLVGGLFGAIKYGIQTALLARHQHGSVDLKANINPPDEWLFSHIKPLFRTKPAAQFNILAHLIGAQEEKSSDTLSTENATHHHATYNNQRYSFLRSGGIHQTPQTFATVNSTVAHQSHSPR